MKPVGASGTANGQNGGREDGAAAYGPETGPSVDVLRQAARFSGKDELS